MEAINRFIAFNDWITFIYILALIILLVAKNTSLYHFRNFLLLIASDKYIKTHKEDTFKKRMHYILTVFQGIITPLFISSCLSDLEGNANLNPIFYLKISALYGGFYILKFFLEKMTGYFLALDTYISSYLFQKQSYFNYLSLWLYPILLGITYYINLTSLVIYVFNAIFLIILLISLILSISNHRKLFYSHPYYFILYLCTFEIALYFLSFFIIPKMI